MFANFEVIEIVDDVNLYPVLLGLDWDFGMDDINNLKRRSMVLENNGTRVVVPMDPIKGKRYTEPMCNEYADEDIDHVYRLTAKD